MVLVALALGRAPVSRRVVATAVAALAVIAARILTMDEAYRSIHWSSIVLIAAAG